MASQARLFDPTVQELLQEREIVYRNLLAAYIKLQDVNREKAELEKRLQEIAVTPTEPVDKRCKLTARQVNEMRQAYMDKVSMRQLAKRYCVSVSTVSNIVHGLYWKSLSSETFAL
jgi:predicted aldo/keto reductase-like oxidoreductase